MQRTMSASAAPGCPSIHSSNLSCDTITFDLLWSGTRRLEAVRVLFAVLCLVVRMSEERLVDESGRLVPELERALRSIEGLESVVQNREDVERVVSREALRNLIDLGYARATLYDPTQQNYPNYFHEAFDHYERTTLGRSYFQMRMRSLIKFLVVHVLPPVLAFVGAVLGAILGVLTASGT